MEIQIYEEEPGVTKRQIVITFIQFYNTEER